MAPLSILNPLTQALSATVTDPEGMAWRVPDIYAVTGLVASFTLGAFPILGLVKLLSGGENRAESTTVSTAVYWRKNRKRRGSSSNDKSSNRGDACH